MSVDQFQSTNNQDIQAGFFSDLIWYQEFLRLGLGKPWLLAISIWREKIYFITTLYLSFPVILFAYYLIFHNILIFVKTRAAQEYCASENKFCPHTEEKAQNRLKVHHANVNAVLSKYKNIMKTIDGNRQKTTVFKEIEGLIKSM